MDVYLRRDYLVVSFGVGLEQRGADRLRARVTHVFEQTEENQTLLKVRLVGRGTQT